MFDKEISWQEFKFYVLKWKITLWKDIYEKIYMYINDKEGE